MPWALSLCSLFFWAGLCSVGARSCSRKCRCGMTMVFYPKDRSALGQVFQGLTSPGSLDHGSPSGMPMKMISKSRPMPMPGHTASLQQLHAINLGKGNSRIVDVFLALASPCQGELRSCHASQSFLALGGRWRAAELWRQPCTGLGQPIGGNWCLWWVDLCGHQACVVALGALPQQRGRIWPSWLSLSLPNLLGLVVPHPLHKSHQPAGS